MITRTEAITQLREMSAQILSPHSKGKELFLLSAAALESLEVYEQALEKLSRLGNEPAPGNSQGNRIAQDALEECRKIIEQAEFFK